MSETAPHIPGNTSSVERFAYPPEAVYKDVRVYIPKEVRARVKANLLGVLAQHNIDPDTVLFSGYTEHLDKKDLEDDEFFTEDGTPLYYFATADALASGEFHPDKNHEIPEEEQDMYFGDPLNFAGTHGRIGVYDRKQILETGVNEEGWDGTDSTDFNVAIGLTVEQLEAAKLFEYYPHYKLTEEQ